ncbi:aminopeptidase N [Phytomonospora endophytica]|uniref:Aminopeptidase N n=1 Tax=Phytomonospora endophytica TaxID=714109 RepID=A0A841F955_9ACTN|nr:aminopeptidase N [Phytomonospora endophytica]MBB6032284.1 aminopeptidase N [Phytomonospora endophytica]GIG68633.1 aminopeptidase N [Phytomonospora endophytica]
MAGTRILKQTDAAERARLLEVAAYDVALDLTVGDKTFVSLTTVEFSCSEPGASTAIELAAENIRSATLNGEPVDTAGYTPEAGLTLTGLAADNTLVIEADCAYSTAGQGLHRMVDGVDGEVYLYSQFEVADAQRMFACFDQPDLKAEFTLRVTVPEHWRAISNMPVRSEEPLERAYDKAKIVHFDKAPRMSTYLYALCAGPYHEVTTEHDGIVYGLYCRESMKQYLDAEGVFEITRQGFDHFHANFGVRYPLPKYDQVFAPEYNMGAMENYGCVTIAEASYLFRSQVTDFELEQRANVILHEMAHMWFGDLVTMRWWDDLWLNESFADWASHWANVEATKYNEAWTTFLSLRKTWGYRQDQLSSTHPVYTDMPDLEAVAANFDGITYAKGASILKQLVAYVGIEPFLAGLRDYFGKHQWGNATFGDLLSSLESASGRELRDWAAQWLETVQVNTLRPEVSVDGDGNYTSVAVRQEAPAEYPTLRTHRIGVGLYDLADGKLVKRDRIELDVAGDLTEIPQLAGVRQPDVLLLNDEDLTYAKIRLDERSLGTVVEHVASFESSLSRALVWTAAFDMVRDAEMAASDFVKLVVSGLPSERDINIVTAILRQLGTAISLYATPEHAPALRSLAAEAAKGAMLAAEPGSGFHLQWTKAFADLTRDEADLAMLRGWLDGDAVPAGLTVDTDLRWHLLISLAGNGAVGRAELDAELERDNTADGQRKATIAQAALPDAASKAEVWERLTTDPELANWAQRSMQMGFWHPDQRELTAEYVSKFLDSVPVVWEMRNTTVAMEYASIGFPRLYVDEPTLALVDAWLADGDRPDAMRRFIAEGRDDIARGLAARARDAQAE